MSNPARRARGNLLVIIILTVAFIVAPLLVILSHFGFFYLDRDRTQATVDAAALVAANELSRIIIADEHFGYVSLSNYAPVGKATDAADGEPLPVSGINTLVGTVRQNAIVAHELKNETMRHLAERDRRYLDETVRNLNATLASAIAGKKKKERLSDIDGDTVDPLDAVARFLASNLPDNVELVSLALCNGWLDGGAGTTTIHTPVPERFAHIPSIGSRAIGSRAGMYKPFVDLPFANQSYTFAGLGDSSRLVTTSDFRKADDKHINSIVKVECVIRRRGESDRKESTGKNPLATMRVSACAQPYSLADSGPKGVMVIRYCAEPASGLSSWSDFLAGNFDDRSLSSYKAMGGDYPADRGARLKPFRAGRHTGTREQFAEHLFYWLRNGRLYPRVDSILAMVDEPFDKVDEALYVYSFEKDGSIARKIVEEVSLPTEVTAESQLSTTIHTVAPGGLTPVIILRNNVRHLGSRYGGKHAGQPLSPSEEGEEPLASLGGENLLSRLSPLAGSFRANDRQVRRSYRDGGLALYIEVGGMRESNADHDVVSMRKLPR